MSIRGNARNAAGAVAGTSVEKAFRVGYVSRRNDESSSLYRSVLGNVPGFVASL